MTLATIIKILTESGYEDVFKLAAQLDAGMFNEAPETVVCYVDKNRLPEGCQFKDPKQPYLALPVIGYNKYALYNKYKVEYPNNTTAWVSDSNSMKTTELIPIVAETLIAEAIADDIPINLLGQDEQPIINDIDF